MNSSKWRSFPMKVLAFLFVLSFSVFILAQPNPPEAQQPGIDSLGSQTGSTAVVVPLTPSVATVFSDGAIAAFSNVTKIANAAITSIGSNNKLKEYGQRLTLMLASIVIVWSIIKNIALKQSLPQLVGDFIFPLVITGFVLTAGLQMLPGVIQSTSTAVAGIFGGGSSLEGMENKFAGSMFLAMGQLWDAKSQSTGFLEFLKAPIDSVAILILKAGIVLLMLLATALGVAAILVAKFQMALATGLAGLFIPWILFKPTEFLFSGWLNFFLKAGFGLVGVMAVSAVTLAGAQGMAAYITTMNADVVDILTVAAMGGMAVIFAYLMLKASDVGEGLIGGSATGIGQLTSVAKGAAGMASPRMAGATAGAAGSVAKLGAARAAGKMAGAGDMGRGAQAVTDASLKRGSFARAAFESARGNKPNKPPDT